MIFDGRGCRVIDGSNNLVATATLTNHTYRLDQPKPTKSTEPNLNLSTTLTTDSSLWHRRLGHINRKSLELMKKKAAIGFNFTNMDSKPCVTCIEGKQHRLPFTKLGKRASKPLELVHSDLCGPMETTSLGGSKYFLTFIDDHTNKVFVFSLTSKNQVFDFSRYLKLELKKKLVYKLKLYEAIMVVNM